MSALLAGYASSDDEDVLGPSTFKTAANVVDDADENDEEIEAQAREDAFGLSSTAPAQASKVVTKLDVTSAPDVLAEDPNAISNAIVARPTDQVVNVNLRYEDMTKPVQGPEDPFNQAKNKGMNSVAGELAPLGCALTRRPR
jgi:pre-mRNA-processing factor 17